MPERVEYFLYYATATIPEIGLTLISGVTMLYCIASFRVHRQDLAILRRNGGDRVDFREVTSKVRSAVGRGTIAALFLFLGLVSVWTVALISPTWASLVSFGLLIAVTLILGLLQTFDRRDRRENIRDLMALRRAREANAAGIIAIDRHSIILQFNAAAERIFGYTADEVIGTSMVELMPERFRDDHLRGMARAYTSDTPGLRMNQVLDLPGLRKDGSEVPLHISLGETKGVAGKIFVSLFTEAIPGSNKLDRDVSELRHETQMAELTHNTEVTTEARDGAVEAMESTDKLRDLMEKLEGERQDREGGC